MSTNYFWKEIPKCFSKLVERDEFTHIGHTAAAGAYCTSCGTTLCSGGTWAVHDSNYEFAYLCPICGKVPTQGAYSFSWTMMKHEKILKRLVNKGISDKVIIDECDREYTPKQFLKIVEGAKIIAQIPGEWR